MARPSQRRSGHNRRAQYGLFASYVIAVILAALGLLLVVVSLLDPPGFAVMRAAAAELTRPVSASLRTFVAGAGTLDEQVAAYFRAGSQNAALRRQVDATRTRLIQAAAIEQENRRLKALLKLVDDEAGEVVAGRLISSSASSPRRIARLNVGSLRGVANGMPVRAPEGLIGRVHAVALDTAEVLLLTDGSSVIPVKRSTDSLAAIATGMGDGSLELRALNAGISPFRPGDVFVTSGTGGVYAPNIPVAVILRTHGDAAVAVPMANPARAEIVLVQRPFQPAITAQAGADNASAAPLSGGAD